MSQYTEVPEVFVKPGNMISYYWSSKLKVGAFIIALGLYVYCILFIKTIYMKNKRLENVMTMAMDTEKLFNNVHAMDRTIAKKIEKLASMLTTERTLN